jgi:hypothetical protein
MDTIRKAIKMPLLNAYMLLTKILRSPYLRFLSLFLMKLT